MIKVAWVGKPVEKMPANMKVLDTRDADFGPTPIKACLAFGRYINFLVEYWNNWPGWPNIHTVLINKTSLGQVLIEALLRMGYRQGHTIHLDDASFALGVIDPETLEIEWLDHGEMIIQKVLASYGYQIKSEEV